jgi:transposase-like protein
VCGESFTLRRQKKKHYTRQFALEVTRRHVEERVSYRVLAKRYRETLGVKVGATSLQRMVEEVGTECKTPAELSRELGLTEWRGYLVADDKHISVGGKTVPWYLGVDTTGDIVHADVLKERTVTEMTGSFFQIIRDDLAYPMKGLTSDQEVLFGLAFGKVFPGKPHQMCMTHALDSLDKHLGYVRQHGRIEKRKREVRALLRSLPDRRTDQSAQRVWEEIKRGYREIRTLRESLQPVEQLRTAVRHVLSARTYASACARWASFHRHRLKYHPAHRTIRDFVGHRWKRLTVYYHHRGMPRTNNIAENTMRQLERRLKTIEGFGSKRSARGYMNLLITYLRTKPYTDCRGYRKYRNRLCRLELAGATLPTTDWLQLCLKSPSKTNR